MQPIEPMTNENVGHGHVFPRPDGVRARCGGPGMCSECVKDAYRKAGQNYQSSMVFAVRELLGSLPKSRDWLNPDAERVFREYLSDAAAHGQGDAAPPSGVTGMLRELFAAEDAYGCGFYSDDRWLAAYKRLAEYAGLRWDDATCKYVLAETKEVPPKENLERAWAAIDAMIVRGELPGNGCDKTAERNGLIIAANKLRQMIDGGAETKPESNGVGPTVARWRCVSYCLCKPSSTQGHFVRDDENGVWVKAEDIGPANTKPATNVYTDHDGDGFILRSDDETGESR